MEPSPKLVAAAERWRTATQEAETARVRLAAEIRADAARGVRQVDIVRATGYTRERIRRIVAEGV